MAKDKKVEIDADIEAEDKAGGVTEADDKIENDIESGDKGDTKAADDVISEDASENKGDVKAKSKKKTKSMAKSESKAEDDVDPESEAEDKSENDSGNAENESELTSGVKVGVVLIDPAYDGLLPVSLLAALIGALLGFIPSMLFTYLTGMIFYPLFIAAPLITYLFNSLLKGGRDVRALIATAVFSLASAYITAISCQAALYTAAHNMSVFQIPLLTVLALGGSGVIPASASAYAYPLVFTIFGVAVVWELLRGAKRRTVEDSEDVGDGETIENEDLENTDD